MYFDPQRSFMAYTGLVIFQMSSKLLAIEAWVLSNNIYVSDFHGKKTDEILELRRPVQATKDLWESKYI